MQRIGFVCALLAGCSVSNPYFEVREDEGSGGTGTGGSTTAVEPTSGGASASGTTTSAGESTSAEATSAAPSSTTDADTTTAPGESSSAAEESTGSDSLCGNGLLDDGEECDEDGEPGGACEPNCRRMFHPVTHDVPPAPVHAVALDVDGDGDLDLAVAHGSANPAMVQVSVLTQVAPGEFEVDAVQDGIYFGGVARLAVGQFTNDPLPDLVVLPVQGFGARLWTNVSQVDAPAFQKAGLVKLPEAKFVLAAGATLDDSPDWDDLVLVSEGSKLYTVANADGDIVVKVPAQGQTLPLSYPIDLVVGEFFGSEEFADVRVAHASFTEDQTEAEGVGDGLMEVQLIKHEVCDGMGIAGMTARDVATAIACKETGTIEVLDVVDGTTTKTTYGGALGPLLAGGFIDVYGDGGATDLYGLSVMSKVEVLVLRDDEEFRSTTMLPVPGPGVAAVAGDFNGDGAEDLAVIVPVPSTVVLLFNQAQLPPPV